MTIHKLEHVIVVSLPAGAWEERLSLKKNNHLIYRMGETAANFIDLPTSHTYSHITRTLTEEECRREVGKCLFLGKYEAYIDYVNSNTSTGSALLSFDSLLTSLSIPTDNLVFVHIDNMKK